MPSWTLIGRSSERNTNTRERERKFRNKTVLKCAVSLFGCFLVKFFSDCLIGKKSAHLGVGRESESRPSWLLCKRILPAESGQEYLLWSSREKVKVRFNVENLNWVFNSKWKITQLAVVQTHSAETAESGLESLLWSGGEKVKVKFSVNPSFEVVVKKWKWN